MAKKQMIFKTKGMNRDLSVSAFNPEFAFENNNLRIYTNEGNTLMSWVNERGTMEIPIYKEYIGTTGTPIPSEELLDIIGICVGAAVLNLYLVLFVTSKELSNTSTNKDSIYRLLYADISKTTMMGVLLYSGNLNLSEKYPLETIVSYEADNILKVYWTDSINLPRVINIKMNPIEYTSMGTVDSRFDFVPELLLKEDVIVLKELGTTGTFAPGVILYAFTYYKKYGLETCIFYTTPLYYISHLDRGAAPDAKVSNSFKITVKNLDMNYDYLRIYSIQRTSINSTPLCKRIQDIELSENLDFDTDRITGIKEYRASYTDNGQTGNSIDPTELLYKGGEETSVETIELKDGTLFLGNISIKRPYIEKQLEKDIKSKSNYSINCRWREFYPMFVSSGSYTYYNQLSSYEDENKTRSVPCGGFKRGDYYRLGVQFQYKTGKWSTPIWLEDKLQTCPPNEELNGKKIKVPIFLGQINKNVINRILSLGYKKARPVVVFPSILDRAVICLGVVCPTMYTEDNRGEKNKYGNYTGKLYALSSWFFRVKWDSEDKYNVAGMIHPEGLDTEDSKLLTYTYKHIGEKKDNDQYYGSYDPTDIKQVEIWGQYNDENKFRIGGYNSEDILTLHSPDIEFDDSNIWNASFENTKYTKVGNIKFTYNMSDIDILTETPTISSTGSGFIHKSFSSIGMFGIVSGLFYDDTIVNDGKDKILQPYKKQQCSCKWMVHAWHKTGSLNNDINRPADKGVATAKLKKKVISNLRYAKTSLESNTTECYSNIKEFTNAGSHPIPLLYTSNETDIVKINNHIYRGNIETLLVPDEGDGNYFAFGKEDLYEKANFLINMPRITSKDIETSFNDSVRWKTFSLAEDESKENGCWIYVRDVSEGVPEGTYKWVRSDTNIGEDYVDLVIKKEPVSMKYKSTPHLVLEGTEKLFSDESNTLSIVEILHPSNLAQTSETRFGGTSADALKENFWIPCGPSVQLKKEQTAWLSWEYGDTYYLRWDCLKTYPFTREDLNLIVEIGSFMLESRVNIDGRYDRNRGQLSNINMSPTNFNLHNPVYSLLDNFFVYKIQNDDYYTNIRFPNQITWTKTKQNGADVDLWTNITLASVLELDGDKGELNKIARFNNQLFTFQDSGISQIMYNENTLISTTEGVPIEIANSGKVDGKRYISNTIGCSNKWSMTTSPVGIYFMDSNNKAIFLFNGELNNISLAGGFNAWCKLNIPSSEKKWNMVWSGGKLSNFENFISYYDKLNLDILFINKDKALAWNEKMSTFTSFYDYGNSPFFENLTDTGIWIKDYYDGNPHVKLWKHNAGEYCNFFGSAKPYWTILVGNPEPQLDKIFTNLEFRACVTGEGSDGTSVFDETFDMTFRNRNKGYNPFLPFDYLETWNEYQHGITKLSNKHGHSAMLHHTPDADSSLKRKFRIWRCDIPRDNAPKSTDAKLGITRFKPRAIDRMRNPWIYIKLLKNSVIQNTLLELVSNNTGTIHQLRAPGYGVNPGDGIIGDVTEIDAGQHLLLNVIILELPLPKTEIHDIVMTYYG